MILTSNFIVSSSLPVYMGGFYNDVKKILISLYMQIKRTIILLLIIITPGELTNEEIPRCGIGKPQDERTCF